MGIKSTRSADGQRVNRPIEEEKAARGRYAKERNKAEVGQLSVDDGSKVVKESDSYESYLFW